MNDSKNVLFSEYNLNGLKLKNRIVMAPMTRNFSPKGVPADYAPTYYAKRAAGGVGAYKLQREWRLVIELQVVIWMSLI